MKIFNETIESIKLYLENCQLVEIDGNDIIDIKLENGPYVECGGVYYDNFYLKISKKAHMNTPTTYGLFGKERVIDEYEDNFERLLSKKDVTYIYLKIESEILRFNVPYSYDCKYIQKGSNSYYYDREGNLVIDLKYKNGYKREFNKDNLEAAYNYINTYLN